MILRRIYDPSLAQASYLIGCPATREALVVDPERDIDRYERLAESLGLRIVAVAETHVHADFVSGARAFAASRPVVVCQSGMGVAAEWTGSGPFHPGASVRFLRDGDELAVGGVRLGVRHTPGHTREAVSFAVLGEDGVPRALLSGDFLFAGDVGRPDLGFLSKAGMSVEESAEALRRSLALLDDLPDAVLHRSDHPGREALVDEAALADVPLTVEADQGQIERLDRPDALT